MCHFVTIVTSLSVLQLGGAGDRRPQTDKKMCTMARFVFVFIILALHSTGVCHAADNDVVDCPGKDEAFVTTCSGKDNIIDIPANEVIGDVDFDENDLVNEVLEDSESEQYQQQRFESETAPSPTDSQSNNFKQNEEAGFCDANDNTPIQQLKANINTLTKRYYDPLPRNGKAAISASAGFILSRISMGVANRLFRLAGATWVLSEMLYTSGFCDEARCVPEEARPWINILRRTVVNQSMKVRVWARKVWDPDRIRELAQKDEFVAGGFATGAFIGFVI